MPSSRLRMSRLAKRASIICSPSRLSSCGQGLGRRLDKLGIQGFMRVSAARQPSQGGSPPERRRRAGGRERRKNGQRACTCACLPRACSGAHSCPTWRSRADSRSSCIVSSSTHDKQIACPCLCLALCMTMSLLTRLPAVHAVQRAQQHQRARVVHDPLPEHQAVQQRVRILCCCFLGRGRGGSGQGRCVQGRETPTHCCSVATHKPATSICRAAILQNRAKRTASSICSAAT